MKLYNTLTGTTDDFSPSDEPVKMYVCGITPYKPSHLGHAMRAVVFDVIRRYLEFIGHEVKHVENFTDIDDKLIKGGYEEGISPIDLAERNIDLYLKEMDSLNVLRAHKYPRATEEISKIQEMITTLINNGTAYPAHGDVYFRVRHNAGYGKLSRRTLDMMLAGARVEANESKSDPMDFALWKSHKPGEPYWDSPWGPGRPGWHIECSAMCLEYLGPTIDIHGGGQDLIFPHHENEIAQTESCTNIDPMARFWVHNGMLRTGEDVMSKSLGNFVSVTEGLERYSPDALRLFFLSSHYRSPQTYSEEVVTAQERALERLRYALNVGSTSGAVMTIDPEPYKQRFIKSMDDDLNTPKAIAVLFDLARDINRAHEQGGTVSESQLLLKKLADILGLTLKESYSTKSVDESSLLALLIEARTGLRDEKRYDLADKLRDQLFELGYMLEDTATGTEWKKKSP